MKRRILVSSNCQTGGVAAALAAILPGDQIIPFPLPVAGDAEGSEKLSETLRIADVWVSSGRYEFAEAAELAHLRPKGRMLKIPEIWFAAFHPDIVYARKVSTGELTRPNYNSAIALWAYQHAIDTADAAKLFSERSYRELGYFERWNSSVAQLEQRFKPTDVDFSQFFLAVKRGGLFMHSLNHPMPPVLCRLAWQIAMQLGAGASLLERPVSINDGLLATIWPVYPSIGERLAVIGSYEWKVDGVFYSGVRAYLDFAYASYATQKIRPDDCIALNIDSALYHRVLGAQLGAKL
jgi:hypothetical protein